MEFLPPEGTEKSKGKGKETYTRVRLAWYYRPADVSDRPVTDPRLLLAAIYSEVAEITQLRGKCHVIHRDKITDLSGWKKRPDRFYFNRLFDPYIKKEFDVIQSSDVRNRASYINIFNIFWTVANLFLKFPTMSKRFSAHDMNLLLPKKKLFQTSPTMSGYVIPVASGVQREQTK